MQTTRLLHALLRRAKLAAYAAFAPSRLHVYGRPQYDHHRLSFSQEGEDLIILRLLGDLPAGLFVDVGAHHPQRFSNTYLLYLQGWRGLNLDANPGSMRAFNALRPRDTNIETGVGEETGERTLYCFNEPALNTFDEALARERDGVAGYRVVSEQPVRTERLDALIERHLPPGRQIDLLNVDVEGWEASVVRSNDWNRFRPKIVALETFGSLHAAVSTTSPAAELLVAHGYGLVAKTANTSIFVDLRASG